MAEATPLVIVFTVGYVLSLKADGCSDEAKLKRG
jgi:hypothetical protein